MTALSAALDETGAQGLHEPRICSPIELLSEKWAVCVLHTLAHAGGTLRFRAIQRSIRAADGRTVSARMLAVTLRHLESAGLVSRAAFAVVPPRVDYALTGTAYSVLFTVDALRELLGAACHAAPADRPAGS